MREIKFRMFVGGKFFYWGFVGDSFYGLTTSNTEPLSLEEQQERSQQYTGLKDRRDVEIFEGDILMVYEWLSGKLWEGHQHKAEVIFEAGKFTFQPRWRGQCLGQDVEVIGNIYENPELLS